MKILVINAGSSSLKFQLIDMDNKNVLAKGLCETVKKEEKILLKITHKKFTLIFQLILLSKLKGEYLDTYNASMAQSQMVLEALLAKKDKMLEE